MVKSYNIFIELPQKLCTFCVPVSILSNNLVLVKDKCYDKDYNVFVIVRRWEDVNLVFRNYEYFLAIVEAGSLTKAAEKLYVSQPSLSQYLRRLEASLDTQLFDRSFSPLRLTYTGERYYQYVLQMVKLDENVRKEFIDIKNQTSGRLRLGLAMWRSACLLPDIFPSFHAQYPNIHLELLEGKSDQLENWLMNDKVDIAVMNLPRTLNYSTLTCEPICEEHILLAAPTEHPAVQQLLQATNALPTENYPIAPLSLAGQIPLVLTKPGQNLTHEIRHALGKNHIEPDILMETGNLTTAINLTARGVACTFVPEEGAKVCQHPGAVTYFRIDSNDLVWELAAVYRKDTYVTQLSRLFIKVMKQQLMMPT